ncbi:MAG: phosphotransferase family protein [Sneathiella sp.]|jgi:aminoglycoside phosphotransferase (APT) family kinase protein|uniref:phosphotransferase n=1 Tax=Sneathiella sp. TaxID=1964365 RepID=UPI000C659FF5|nr:phosphotransferase [Sneathiella sp.]MAL78649.1 phosphotransferase family protein [Sneathiella sp.]
MSDGTIIIPVREAHQFDEGALYEYLKANIDGFKGPLKVRQFQGGQSNPTFLLETPERDYVMRKKPPGVLLPSAHAVDREYRVISALQNTNVPVPRTYCLCEDPEIIGTAFYVMERINGRVITIPSIPKMAPEQRSAIYDSMNDALAKMHNVDVDAVGLSDFGKKGGYLARQVNRWSKQYRASQTHELEGMENLIKWLPDNIPADDESTIVHGDFRLGNLILHPTEPRVLAILDWELATIGHPLSDLAYNCMAYHFVHPINGGLVDFNLKEMGIPSEQEYIDAYCKRTGRDGIDNWEYYIAFSLFRVTAIVQGVYKRGLDGNASSEVGEEYTKYAKMVADLGWQYIEKRG